MVRLWPPPFEILQRQQVRRDQVADMDIVAHPGPSGVKIRAENIQMRIKPQRHLAGPLDQMRRLRRRLSRAAHGSAPATLK